MRYRGPVLIVVGLVLAPVIALWFWGAQPAWLIDALSHLDADQRRVVYGGLSGVSAALMGFMITSIAILLATADNPQVEVLYQSSAAQRVLRQFRTAARWLAYCVVVSLAGLVLDRDDDGVTYLMLLSLVMVGWTLVRLSVAIWALEKVVDAIVQVRQGTQPRRLKGAASKTKAPGGGVVDAPDRGL